MQLLERRFYRILSRHIHSGATGKGRLISISHGNKDEWSGFADLFANLIEKYAAVLDLDNLPEPLYSFGGEETVNNLEHSEDDVENAETAQYN